MSVRPSPQLTKAACAAAIAYGAGDGAMRRVSRAFRGRSFQTEEVAASASGRKAVDRQLSAVYELRRHGFLWLAKEGPQQRLHVLRFPLPLRHELLPRYVQRQRHRPGANVLAW